MATAYQPTIDFHSLIAAGLPQEEGQDWADAQRGFIGTTEHAEVLRSDGHWTSFRVTFRWWMLRPGRCEPGVIALRHRAVD